MVHRLIVAVGLALVCCGCANQPLGDARHIVIVVSGAGGYGPGIGNLIRGLHTDSPEADFEVFHWGVPAPLFMLNLQNDAIHRDAERKLARWIESRAAMPSQPRIDLVGHSAGCGVALGAMALLRNVQIDTVMMLSPSVSPGYDLRPALDHASGSVHVFYSSRDTLWLGWRASHFGTYDNVKTRAAGNAGFDNAPVHVIQHAYDPGWQSLGNDGGHFGTLSFRFAKQTLSSILAEDILSSTTLGNNAIGSGR